MIAPAKLLTVLLVGLAPLAGPEEVDFASLSDFDYVEGMTLPDHVTRLHKQRITLTGFMQREDGGTEPTDFFMLINEACGCDGTPFLNEVVFCAMPSGEETEIKPGSVKITGTLYVGEMIEEGIVTSIYRLDVEKVED